VVEALSNVTEAARMIMEVADWSVVEEEAVMEVISIEKSPALAAMVQQCMTHQVDITVTIVWTVQVVIAIAAARMIADPSLPRRIHQVL